MARKLTEVERDLHALVKRQREAKSQLTEISGEAGELVTLIEQLNDGIMDLVKERAEVCSAPLRIRPGHL